METDIEMNLREIEYGWDSSGSGCDLNDGRL
jgi:hypothetical protein